jgi:hypothetical protein
MIFRLARAARILWGQVIQFARERYLLSDVVPEEWVQETFQSDKGGQRPISGQS